MDREPVARILEEIGTILELNGENPFKCNAYRSAARALEGLQEDLAVLVAENRLRKVKGIGESIAEKITQLVQTGRLPFHEDLRKQVPDGVLDLLRIPGLGPKKARALWKDLGVDSIDALEKACNENRLVGHAGFGQKTQDNLLKGIEQVRSSQGKHLFHRAWEEGERIRARLESHPAVKRLCAAGSLRRRKEVVRDLDLVVSTADADAVMDHFVGLDLVGRVLSKGPTRSSVVLKSGMQADLRAVTDEEYPFALHYFTGSKEHNTALRGRARKMGLKLNEYGLFRDEERIPCADEAELFRVLGLAEIPAELREDTGEIEAAERRAIPRLVEESDLQGVFHVHSRWSDGVNTIAEMVDGARRKGWRYLGITDHSRSAAYAGGLDRDKIRRQHEEIDSLQASLKDFRIFKGSEVDILPDGSLDYEDEILAQFDFVVASVHSKFKMTEEEATRRIIRAMENPHVTFLGHPTGRLLLEREGYPVNMHAVIESAAALGVAIEINSHPLRLDLDWRYGRFAREQGLRIGIFPDAHAVEGLHDVRYGVGIARKAWMRPEDVVNTMDTAAVTAYLAKRRTGTPANPTPKAKGSARATDAGASAPAPEAPPGRSPSARAGRKGKGRT